MSQAETREGIGRKGAKKLDAGQGVEAGGRF